MKVELYLHPRRARHGLVRYAACFHPLLSWNQQADQGTLAMSGSVPAASLQELSFRISLDSGNETGKVPTLENSVEELKEVKMSLKLYLVRCGSLTAFFRLLCDLASEMQR